MSDYSNLKALALEVPEGIVAPAAYDDDRSYSKSEVKLLNFLEAATPAVVLGLISENEAMTEFKAHMVSLREADGFDSWVAVLVELDRLKAENEALRKDASRWRAFINCARIKFFGWAGYVEKDPYGNSPGNYRHFGGEFWTIHDAPTADKEKAAEILNGFADAAVAAMGKGEQSDIHHTSYALAHEPIPTCASCGVQMFTGIVPNKLCKGCQLD